MDGDFAKVHTCMNPKGGIRNCSRYDRSYGGIFVAKGVTQMLVRYVGRAWSSIASTY